ncbi:MAG: hypothetical protein KF886_26290 [Candidatus Hydrogenedentes bacterium]|nr:hypothetical protein [Candidatus Hydrogenedentota bacterium]
MNAFLREIGFAAIVLGLAGVASAEDVADDRGEVLSYVLDGADGLVQRFAPVFLIEHAEEPFNRIGTPSAEIGARGREKVLVDPSHATIYTEVETFATDRDRYTNLIYRIHFQKNPFTLVPLNVGAGKNVGFIAVITLNSREEPVWLSTVQSCGCYHAIIPTDYLAESAYPDDWNVDDLEVYGEHLPGLLKLKAAAGKNPGITITIRGGSHRCMDVAVETDADATTEVNKVTAEAAPVEALKHLPLPDGSETSFYHEKGHRKGLVKGAYKPLETILFGLWAWDHNVGQDREYGPKEKVGRRFYTTLFFARKKEADMWHFARYLEHNGWKP